MTSCGTHFFALTPALPTIRIAIDTREVIVSLDQRVRPRRGRGWSQFDLLPGVEAFGEALFPVEPGEAFLVDFPQLTDDRQAACGCEFQAGISPAIEHPVLGKRSSFAPEVLSGQKVSPAQAPLQRAVNEDPMRSWHAVHSRSRSSSGEVNE